jgi:protein-tyrosine phosphatase
MNDKPKTVSVLFVCLGNICRSPAAHAVFQKMAQSAGVGDRFYIDSAGILDYHEGELPDPRMRQAAEKRGYELTHRSRPITKDDFYNFDLVLAMDREIFQALEQLAPPSNEQHQVARVELFMNYVNHGEGNLDVPDPYWSGSAGFDLVMDLVEEGCRNLLRTLCQDN